MFNVYAEMVEEFCKNNTVTEEERAELFAIASLLHERRIHHYI